MSLYRNILGQGWKITWHNKYLWFFGIFAALLGNGGEYEILIRGLRGETGSGLFPNFSRIADTGIFSISTLSNIGQLFRDDFLNMFIILIIGLIALTLFGFLVWLTIISQVALVSNTVSIISKKNKGQKVGIKEGINVGASNFWPIFGLNIIIKLIVYSAFILVSLPIIFSAKELGVINWLYVSLFIILIPTAIALSFLIKYAIAYVVIKGSNFFDSIKLGWQLFIKNWLISVEMAFILFFINFLIGIGIILLLLILAIPFLFLSLILYKLIALAGFWIIAITALILFLFIVVAGGAALATFQTASWTGLFIELVSKGGTSKITRILNGFKK